MNLQQLIAPTIAAPTNARKVKPSKIKAKAPSTEALKIEALRKELTDLTGAPCSPVMGVASLEKAIAKAKLPPEPEQTYTEQQQEALEVLEAKPRVIPAKAQGIGAHCVALLKSGMKPADVHKHALLTFPEAKTSMACVYWYASKIKAGVL